MLIHALKDLCFSFQDTVPCLQIFQMALSDVGYDTDIRLCHLCQTAHFPEIADSHFENRHLIFLPDPQDRKRKPDLIIKITLCLHHMVFSRKHTCDHFFCTRLTHASGNAHNMYGKLLAIKGRDLFQRSKAVLYQNIREIRIRQFLLRYNCKCTFFHYLPDKGMPVYPFPLCCNKQSARLYLTGIDHYISYLLLTFCRISMVNAADRGDIFQCHIFHHFAFFLIGNIFCLLAQRYFDQPFTKLIKVIAHNCRFLRKQRCRCHARQCIGFQTKHFVFLIHHKIHTCI